MRIFRIIVFIFVWGCIAGVLYAGVYHPVQVRKADAMLSIAEMEKELSELQSRVATLLTVETDISFPNELLWAAPSQVDAELLLQDAIVKLADQIGIPLISFGSSSLTRDSAQGVAAFEFEAETSVSQLFNLLSALEALQPRVAVGILRVRPSQSVNSGSDLVPVYAQVSVWAFWGEPS